MMNSTLMFMVGVLVSAILTNLVPISGAKASESSLRGACQITERIYTTTNHRDYTLVDSSIVNRTDGDVRTSLPLILTGQSDPVSYVANFHHDGRIEGELQIQIDQPGPRMKSSTNNFNPLSITLEDTYNGGMTTYQLNCSFDVVD